MNANHMPDTPFLPEILDTIVQRQDILPDCTLWQLDIQKLPVLMPEDIVSILHESSVIRYSELSRKQRRTQFVVGRLLTKYAISRLLGKSITELTLIERRSNIPQLRTISPLTKPIYYSLAYRYDHAVCATSRLHLTGLDVEVVDPKREIATPAETAFNAHENAWLSALPAKEWYRGYYELWTRKEACYKLLSCKHGGIHNDSFWRVDCLSDNHFEWKTLQQKEGLLITVCQADPALEISLTQTSHYNLDKASDIFKR